MVASWPTACAPEPSDWLVSHGVPADQLEVRSEGKNRLLEDPDYPDEHKAHQNGLAPDMTG